MNAQVKNFLVISLKNAVNAILVSGILKILFTGSFNFTSRHDWIQFGWSFLSTVAVREAMVWGPILLQWSVTSANPSAQRQPDGGLVIAPPQNKKEGQ